ncbi:MAG: hypothetical protein CXX81_18420 [Methanobacteriota archaeon]|nr:MAG: hypothetical protein CXX81_18420 [Euryarchaeota archaeon]HIO86846.1 hypothetical protein [Candidatus Poseidoniales archaeon]
MNIAQSLLGPLYDLYVSALGQTVGMIVGYVTLVGIFALVWWLLANRNEVISGLDLRVATIGNMIVLILLGGILYVVMSSTFGFPFIGAISMTISSVLLVYWCMTNFEGEPI